MAIRLAPEPVWAGEPVGDMRSNGFWREQFRLYRLWIFERRRAEIATAAEPLPSGITLRLLGRHARRDWACQRTAAADWPQYRIALENDHDLILAERGGETVGWAWIGYRRVFLAPLGRSIRLQDGTGYLYDVFVRPAERGHGIGRALVGARVAHAEAAGITRLVSHVRLGNVASRRALERHGFAVIGQTAFLRLLAFRLWTRTPLPTSRAA